MRGTSRSPLLQVAKTSVAVIAAWLLSTLLLSQPLPIFAAIAALLVVQPSVNQSLAKGVERSVGVILGVVTDSSEPLNKSFEMTRYRGVVVGLGLFGMDITRSRMFEKRRRLMQQWATFCTTAPLQETNNVAPMRRMG